MSSTLEQLTALSHHLNSRRGAIMEAWRAASDADPNQTTSNALTRSQFNDHIPEVLNAFERKLRARPGGERAADADEDQREEEVKHGLHRWQQGYRLREITREWGHLHLCLSAELDAFAAAHPEMTRESQSAANRELIMLVNNAINESTAQYARMEREEATARAHDLEIALAQIGELERKRGALIREAVHDLGGNIQAVSSAASLLGVTDIPEEERRIFSEMLKRGVGTLRSMLGDLMDLARLEAGEQQRKIAGFDAAVVLAELCKVSEPFAVERRLTLASAGPGHLLVEGDADKVHRIAQNLVINALKYTEEGGVTVSWGEEGDDKWWLMVKDTGPGMQAGPGAPLLNALKEATASARDSAEKAEDEGEDGSGVLPESSPETDFLPIRQQPGEGIGLSIVKRLCELLDASLELASSEESGTTFRVLIPRRYNP